VEPRTGLFNCCAMQFALLTLPTVPSSVSHLFMHNSWQSKWTISTARQLRHSDILTVKTKCSEADGYSAHKQTCRLWRNATCLYAHPVPVLIPLITPAANRRHSAFWSGLNISYFLNKIMCAVPILRATYSAYHGDAPISILIVHYCFDGESTEKTWKTK
jgi:hypothetical protein